MIRKKIFYEGEARIIKFYIFGLLIYEVRHENYLNEMVVLRGY